MPDYRETAHDFRIKYSGCVMKCTGLSKDLASLVVIGEDISTDNEGNLETVRVTTFKKDKDNQTTTNNKTVNIKNLQRKRLKLGAVNLARSVVLINQNTADGSARYRALHHRNTLRLVDPLMDIRRILELRSPTEVLDWFVLSAWGEEQFSTPTEALEQVVSGQYLARAFTNKFYFATSTKSKYPVLMYLNHPIGEAINGRVVLLKSAIRFKEELEGFGLQCEEAA